MACMHKNAHRKSGRKEKNTEWWKMMDRGSTATLWVALEGDCSFYHNKHAQECTQKKQKRGKQHRMGVANGQRQTV